MFESLSDRLEGAFQVLQGNNKLTDINIAQSVREIRRALVAADVNYKIAKEFTDKVKDEALGTQNVVCSHTYEPTAHAALMTTHRRPYLALI